MLVPLAHAMSAAATGLWSGADPTGPHWWKGGGGLSCQQAASGKEEMILLQTCM